MDSCRIYFSDGGVNWFLSKRLKALIERNRQQLEEVGIHIDIQKMNSFNVLERRMVRVVRARKKGAHILILEDECEGMGREMLCSYEQILKESDQESYGDYSCSSFRYSYFCFVNDYKLFSEEMHC